MGRVHRLRRARRPGPVLVPDVERYFGPARLEVVTHRGSWSPRVDVVGLGFSGERGTLEAAMLDGDGRPTLPWWLRTTPGAKLAVHGIEVAVDAPTVRHRGRRTVLRWATTSPELRAVLAAAKALPAMFTPILTEPLGPEERAVLRDYALSTGDGLADWF